MALSNELEKLVEDTKEIPREVVVKMAADIIAKVIIDSIHKEVLTLTRCTHREN